MITAQINEGAVDSLMKEYKDTNDKTSYTDTEKVVACIYMLQEFGIPLKSSSISINVDPKATFKLFKLLKKPAYFYIGKFIDYLTRFYDNEYKKEFCEKFNMLQYQMSDQFIMAVALNMVLRKKNGDKFVSRNSFDYSDVSLLAYKRVIKKVM
jgi:hypothetical protein